MSQHWTRQSVLRLFCFSPAFSGGLLGDLFSLFRSEFGGTSFPADLTALASYFGPCIR